MDFANSSNIELENGNSVFLLFLDFPVLRFRFSTFLIVFEGDI